MISWIIVITLLVIAIIAIKINHFRHRTWIILMIFLALFLYLSAMAISDKMDFSSSEKAISSFKVYLGWIGNGFENMKTLVGNAIKMDWTNTNSSLRDII